MGYDGSVAGRLVGESSNLNLVFYPGKRNGV